jgi:dihydroxyacetone kinase
MELLEIALWVCEQTGGSFGGMMSVFFRGAVDFLPDDKADFSWSAAWHKGLKALEVSGAARIGYRSFMDALIPAIENCASLKDATLAARKGADSTASLVAKVGRACYVPQDRYMNHNDAGAEAVAIFFSGMLESIA